MLGITKTIESKSDHLSADDLIGGALTIEITKVSIVNGDRPVVIDYVGGDGRSFLPCKTMRRVMAGAWGVDGNEYIGRHMTLYRDASVVFGGKEVGGIRISHISGISETLKWTLSSSRGKKSLFTVKPLDIVNQKQEQAPERPLADIENDINNCQTEIDLNAVYRINSRHSRVTEIVKACKKRKAEILSQEQEIDYDAEPQELKEKNNV